MGKKAEEIAEITNISCWAVRHILCAYNRKGMACLDEKVRGRKFGEQRILSSEQEEELQQVITDMSPRQVELPFDAWTRGAVQRLIKERYSIDVALRTISLYFDRWGMTCQRPAKRAYHQDKKNRRIPEREVSRYPETR
jgi:transposase